MDCERSRFRSSIREDGQTARRVCPLSASAVVNGRRYVQRPGLSYSPRIKRRRGVRTAVRRCYAGTCRSRILQPVGYDYVESTPTLYVRAERTIVPVFVRNGNARRRINASPERNRRARVLVSYRRAAAFRIESERNANRRARRVQRRVRSV